MSAPKGRTIREQLEAWVAGQPESRRESALRVAGLDELYSTIRTEGELSKKVQFSLQHPKTQRKLTDVGIDVDSTWVDMAKKATDPTKDWFPDATTRTQVVNLLRPYVEKIGGTDQLSRLFFGGRDLGQLFCKPPQRSLPGFETVVGILKFCLEDERSGGERRAWTSEWLTLLEGQWNEFGRGNVPFPELTSAEAFTTWFARNIPHERVDHVAKALNDALHEVTFKSPLLIQWRKGNLPSREKYQALMRGIRLAFPEWLPVEFRDGKTQPKVAKEDTVVAEVQPPAQPLEKPEAGPSSIEDVIERGFILLLQELREFRVAQNAREQVPVAVVQETQPLSSPAAVYEDPGEVMHGLRFVLTARTFKHVEVFNLDEVEDTARLIGELARRQALMNSMALADKRAVLRGLKTAYNELFIQMRNMDASREDLPAMFQEMRIVAAALSGANLEDITS